MQIKIVDRADPYIRYFVYNDLGVELRQVHRDCSTLITAARRRHESLEKALVRYEEQV